MYIDLLPHESHLKSLISFSLLGEELSNSCTSVRDTTFNADLLDFSGKTQTVALSL